MTRRTLLTFVGSLDPHVTSAGEDGPEKGPILTVLVERKFDRVVLISRPHRHEQLKRTWQAMRELHPKLTVESHELELADSSYHPEILEKLRGLLARLRRAAPQDDFTISLLSGSPEIHACWIVIAATGEFPARMLNFRRSVHSGFAGPRQLRELEWHEPLATLSPERLSLLSTRRDRWDDTDQQGPAAIVPRHYFAPRTLEQAMLLSHHAAPLLIRGEAGTQKQMLAALVHQFGSRNNGPFLIVNCATLPKRFFESALFGGSENDGGKLREADGGTLLFIKVQHMPAPVLRRLLKAASDGYAYGARSNLPAKVNVRLVFTTDRDLEDEVRHGHFSAEAWRRLQACTLRLPALRERPTEIAALARAELERLNRTLPRPHRFSPGAIAKLEGHRWPSNVSELRRVVEQAVLNADQGVIAAAEIDLGLEVNMANVFTLPVPRMREGFSLGDYLRTVKQEIVRSALRKSKGNQSVAARILGITPQAVSKLLREKRA